MALYSRETLGIILLAGGASTRYGEEDKLGLRLLGRNLIEINDTKARYLSDSVVIMATQAQQGRLCRRVKSPTIYGPPGKAQAIVDGVGYLMELETSPGAILLMEAARPFLSLDQARLMVAGFYTGDVLALLPCCDPVESTYMVRCPETMDFDDISDKKRSMTAQTPEVWNPLTLGRVAREDVWYKEYDYSLAAYLPQHQVGLIKGDPRNFKVTRRHDAIVASALARKYKHLVNWGRK